ARGRGSPGWSRLPTAAPAQIEARPASIARLPARSAGVGVGPPLFASGPRPAATSFNEPAPKPQLVPSSRLTVPSVTVPEQLPPVVLPARMVFESATSVWGAAKRPPPAVALLPAMVAFSTSASPATTMMPPPLPLAPFPENVQLLAVKVPASSYIPPPSITATLPDNV